MKPKGFNLAALSAILLLSGSIVAHAETPPQTLFVNVHVFDGVSDKRLEDANVLVEGNLIKKVSRDSIDAPGANVIDGGGYIGLANAEILCSGRANDVVHRFRVRCC